MLYIISESLVGSNFVSLLCTEWTCQEEHKYTSCRLLHASATVFRRFHLTLYFLSFQACVPPGAFLTGSSGVFSSPNFRNNFPANSNCTWNITVPSGLIIKVSFFNFTLEPNQNTACIGEPPGARVFITNVASDNGFADFQLCGQNLPSPVYSVGNSIQVRLVSLTNVYSGFNASYEAIDAAECKWTFLRTLNVM